MINLLSLTFMPITSETELLPIIKSSLSITKTKRVMFTEIIVVY